MNLPVGLPFALSLGTARSVGSQVGVMTSPWKGISPRLTTCPFAMTGRITQSVGLFGGICHDVATWPGGPTSVTLQSVDPWSNTQLWPAPVRGCDGSLCSLTDVSGTHSEPVGPGKTLGDQFGD